MKRLLLRLLGADKLVRRAFREGFHMGRELNPHVWDGHAQASFYGYHGCWKAEVEAWVNSDAEEKL